MNKIHSDNESDLKKVNKRTRRRALSKDLKKNKKTRKEALSFSKGGCLVGNAQSARKRLQRQRAGQSKYFCGLIILKIISCLDYSENNDNRVCDFLDNAL